MKVSPLLPGFSSSDDDDEDDGDDPSLGSPYDSFVVIGLMDAGCLSRLLAVSACGVRSSSSIIVPFISPVPFCFSACSVECDAWSVWVARGCVVVVVLAS